MEFLLTVIAVVTAITSSISTIVHTVITYKKSKEPPKDEVWETAERMISSKLNEMDADEFARLYLLLKFFKEHPEDLKGFDSIEDAMNAKSGARDKEPQ